MPANEETVENICQAFAEIIDAKSPFTYRHSNGVADAAVAISRQLSLSEQDVTFMRRAALLHDIGKLCVPNIILEKPAHSGWRGMGNREAASLLTATRFFAGSRVSSELSEVAGAHHEKLDGSGYFRESGRTAAFPEGPHPGGGRHLRCTGSEAPVPGRDAFGEGLRDHSEGRTPGPGWPVCGSACDGRGGSGIPDGKPAAFFPGRGRQKQ